MSRLSSNALQPTRCNQGADLEVGRIAAELWSFENIKNFVQEHIGLAIVPGMIYREQGYLSDSARELIRIVRSFNWDAPHAQARPRRTDAAAFATCRNPATRIVARRIHE